MSLREECVTLASVEGAVMDVAKVAVPQRLNQADGAGQPQAFQRF